MRALFFRIIVKSGSDYHLISGGTHNDLDTWAFTYAVEFRIMQLAGWKKS
jgi:hypothetical protein